MKKEMIFKNDGFYIELGVKIDIEDNCGNNNISTIIIDKIEDYGRINVSDDGNKIVINIRGQAEQYTLSKALKYIAEQLDMNGESDYEYGNDIMENIYRIRKIKNN